MVPTVPVAQRCVPGRHMAEGRGLQQGGAQVEGGAAQLAHRLHLYHFHLLAAHCDCATHQLGMIILIYVHVAYICIVSIYVQGVRSL